jgi:anti-sigma B factor antagonist
MEFTVREEQGSFVVSFGGEVDLEHSPKAREVLLDCVAKVRDVFVDLSAVSYIDSSGVASLVEAFQTSKKKGTSFALVAVNPAAMRVLQLARLDKVFKIHETLPEGFGGNA